MTFIQKLISFIKREKKQEPIEFPNEIGEFTDLPEGALYTDYAKTLIDVGIMRGYSDKTWRPDVVCTRGEVARLIIGTALKSEEIKKTYERIRKK